MSWPYLHTLVNHFPIVLTVVGALAVLFAAMYVRRAVWIYALSTLTLAGLTIYPAWLTGDRAADAVRHAWYIERGAIQTHSTAADVTLWIVGVTGFLAFVALITMIRSREAVSPARVFRVLVGLGATVSICAVSYTGFLGGKIVVESPILASPTPPVIAVPVPAPGTVPVPSMQTPQSPSAYPSPANPMPPATLVPQTAPQIRRP
jgi:uncharacterized membrane protein